MLTLFRKATCVLYVVCGSLCLQLPEFFESDGSEEARVALHNVPALSTSIPRLILRQLRWLDFVMDCPALVRLLLQCLQVQHTTTMCASRPALSVQLPSSSLVSHSIRCSTACGAPCCIFFFLYIGLIP